MVDLGVVVAAGGGGSRGRSGNRGRGSNRAGGGSTGGSRGGGSRGCGSRGCGSRGCGSSKGRGGSRGRGGTCMGATDTDDEWTWETSHVASYTPIIPFTGALPGPAGIAVGVTLISTSRALQ